MAFPVVATTGYHEDTGSVNDHTATYPTSIASGDLLILVLITDGTVTITSGLSSWTNLTETANGTACELHVYYKTADGSESGDFTISHGATAERMSIYIARITGWHGTTAPEVGTASTGNTTTPDPPSVTPSWGAEDTLWMACYGADAASTLQIATDGPTNYQLYEFFEGVEVSGAVTIGIACRELNATTDNPGSFTCGGTADQWVGQTIAIRPAAGGAAPTLHMLSLLGVGK